MWIQSYSKVYQGVTQQQAWQAFTDVNHWVDWHHDLDACAMTGPFVVGNFFKLKPKGYPEFKVTLTEVIEGKKFTDCTRFFGAKMYNSHEFEDTPEGLCLTHTVMVTGILKWLWIKLVAKNVADSTPAESQALIDYCLRTVA